MEEWKEYKLGEIASMKYGKLVPKNILSEGSIPIYSGYRYVGYTDKSNCSKDTIIVVARGVGGTGDVKITKEDCFLTNLSIAVNLDKDICIPYYFYYKYLLNNLKYLDSGSAQSQITIDDLKRLIVKLPNIETQCRIVKKVRVIDDKIEVNRRINEQLEELAGALFKSWFVDFEPFKDGEFVESELGMIPKGWKVIEVGELCESISVKHKFDKNELIFLNTGDIHNNIYLHNNYMPINEMPGQAKKSIRKGDILYSEIRPINKHFAFVNFEANDYVVSTKLMVIRCRNINNLRLYQYLTSNEIIDFLQQEAETRSGTFPQIRFENIQRLKMIIASPIVEEQYDKNLLPIYNKIETNNKEITHLTTLRDTLLPKLMSGEIDVNEVKI